ncbi:DUF1819 family protein [Peribacillus asahii]|uniref:DUF1819 family protein n=1 Tax=Peribacillus asahii TaxID=228899 RepID=UPI002079E5FE|nr:DUF1819 family protein [Peribacillus asahii]USK68583.1 DUF1819 family protein [Peribacillus asahii]
MKVYSGGFTAERLYRPEMKIVVELQLSGLSKEEIREKVFADNLFQCRSAAAMKDIFPRVYQRAELLDRTLKTILLNGSRSDQNALLLYAFLKRFAFPRDLVLELIHYNSKNYKYVITDGNVETFMDEKSELHESIRNWTEKTRYKIKQVTLKTLVDAELLVKNGKEYNIISIPISKELQQYVEQQKDYLDLLRFTLND